MEKIFALTPRDTRSAFFFWLGVGVFPAFWSWFTLGKKFPRWQQALALGWLLITFAAFTLAWPQILERYKTLSLGLPLLSLLVTLGLGVWLALRTLSFLDWFLFYIVTGGVLPLQWNRLVAHAVEQDFSCKWATLPLVPAFFHLLASVSQNQQPRLKGDSDGKDDS